MGPWSLLLSFWLILSLATMGIAALCAVVFLVSLIGSILGINLVIKNGRGFTLMGLTFPLIAKFVTNYLLLLSFWYLAANDLIGINPDSELPGPLVRRTAAVVIILNFVVLLVWFLFKNFLGVIPYDYYDYSVKDDLTKHAIMWRFYKDRPLGTEDEVLIKETQSDNLASKDENRMDDNQV